MKKLSMVLLLITLSSSVFARSNCDRPRDDFDDLYCLNKVYLQADKDLNEAYSKLSKKLNSEGDALLKQGQLAWIKSRNDDCSYKDNRGFFVNIACATKTTIERTQFLTDRYRECVSSGCLNSKLK